MGASMDFCERESAEGYLGMGIPNVGLGLKWFDVSDDHVRAAREFFKSRWSVKGFGRK